MRKTGYHDFSLNFYLSHSTETFRRGALLCFTKFLVSKNFMHKRGYLDFVENFFLTAPKNFVGEPLCFRKILVSKNVMHITILSIFFVSPHRKTSLEKHSVFQEISSIEKFHA